MFVIFHRPIRLGKDSYPAGRRPVELADKLADDKFIKGCIDQGYMTVVAAPEKAAAPAAVAQKPVAPAAPAKGK